MVVLDHSIGDSLTVKHLTLDQKFGVRIPVPELQTTPGSRPDMQNGSASRCWERGAAINYFGRVRCYPIGSQGRGRCINTEPARLVSDARQHTPVKRNLSTPNFDPVSTDGSPAEKLTYQTHDGPQDATAQPCAHTLVVKAVRQTPLTATPPAREGLPKKRGNHFHSFQEASRAREGLPSKRQLFPFRVSSRPRARGVASTENGEIISSFRAPLRARGDRNVRSETISERSPARAREG